MINPGQYYYIFPVNDNDLRTSKDQSKTPLENTENTPEETLSKGNLFKNLYDPYKNYDPKLPKPKNEKQAQLFELMSYGAFLHDLVLYLDVIPNDTAAIEQYEVYSKKYKDLAKNYQDKYGPLLVSNSRKDNGRFSWLSAASPWIN